MAVAATTGVSSPAVAAGLAIDNLFGLLYFPLVNWLGSKYTEDGAAQPALVAATGGASAERASVPAGDNDPLPGSIISERVGAGEAASTSTATAAGGSGSSPAEFGSVEDCLTALAIAMAVSAVSETILPSAAMPVATAMTGAWLLELPLSHCC